jgi:2-oxo-4-hydroxy-4-carboxy--5-ureidoimidazoline (OHCU) decarboxylase
MAAFDARFQNDRATELAEACRQVERIALHRLRAMLPR